ncbi:MAG: hypothetical protein NPIRA03_07370 [Nitrospirales bacterium]|nr:MAG: hypothetical protein NPIRA03_07370 [Nitrospirales bacterium]
MFKGKFMARTPLAAFFNRHHEKNGVTSKKEIKQISQSGHVVHGGLEDQLLKLYLNFYKSEGFIDVDFNEEESAGMSAGELRESVKDIRHSSRDSFTFLKAYMNMAYTSSKRNSSTRC